MSFGRPKIPAAKPPPTTPTRASFVSRGSSFSDQRSPTSARPITPVIGASKSNVGRPSLLGG